MRLLALSMLLFATVGLWGQAPCSGGGEGHKNPPDCMSAEQYIKQFAQPKPLKCGKWEHVEWQIRAKVIGIPGGDSFEHVPGSEYCAPDMQLVTVKDWQELIARVKKLEDAHEKH